MPRMAHGMPRRRNDLTRVTSGFRLHATQGLQLFVWRSIPCSLLFSFTARFTASCRRGLNCCSSVRGGTDYTAAHVRIEGRECFYPELAKPLFGRPSERPSALA